MPFLIGPKSNFRRWNSYGWGQKKKKKSQIPRENGSEVSSRRRSLSCRDYGRESDFDLEGLERVSSEHDVRGNAARIRR